MAKTTAQDGPMSDRTDSKLEAFAEDLGRLLGEARNKADNWMAQREAIAKHLVGVRDTANQLLGQMGIGSSDQPRRRGRPAGSAAPGPRRGPGRPPKAAAQADTETPRRRTMSAAARRKISAAQRARWAKVKAAKK